MAAIGGGVFTSLFTFIPVMFGSWNDRKKYEQFMLGEFKSLKERAEANFLVEQQKRIEAEAREVAMANKLQNMSKQISELQNELHSLREELKDKNEIEENYEDLIVSYDNLESEHEELTKKYITLEIEFDKQKLEILELLKIQRPVTKFSSEDDGMDPSGVPPIR